MSVRYQVFVSSTFTDLKAERSAVIQTLMEMDCIPAGMELFPAMDEEQWMFIRRIIDDCDYYILILGGRYGSVSEDGVSYTEREFDYALSRGMKVLAFIHGEPDNLPMRNGELDPAVKQKLDAFRARVSDGRLVKFWTETKELPGLVALSMPKTIKTYPAVGWVRGDRVASAQLLAEQNELRKEIEQLRAQLAQYEKGEALTEDLASVDELFTMDFSWSTTLGTKQGSQAIECSWKQIFTTLAPDLQRVPSDGFVQQSLTKSFFGQRSDIKASIREESLKTIRIQLIALGLVDVHYSPTEKGGNVLFWRLTEKGEAMMFKWRTVKPSSASDKQ